MVKKPVNQMSPGLQFLVFVAVAIGTVILFNLIGFGIIMAVYGMNAMTDIASFNFTNPDTVNALWILQIISTTIPLLLAPLFYAYVIVRNPAEYLKPYFSSTWLLFVVAFFVMLISSPLIELLSNINKQMVLPPYLHGLEEWMKSSEESAQRLIKAMLQMDTVGEMIKNVLLIGLATAVVEEFMFRGVLQTIMQRWTKNTHAAIWVTAALFSAFHMEFYGFLPRMLLGALFGYFVAWSGSIWPAVWGHFLNNGTAVVVTYLFQTKKIAMNPDEAHTFSYISYIFSAVIVIILLLTYKKLASGKKQAVNINGEELG